MLHFKLRTLLIVLALGPMVLAAMIYLAAHLFGLYFDATLGDML